MTGTSELPYSIMSMTPTMLNLEDRPPAFGSSALSQHPMEPSIRPIPFDMSPLAVPTILKSTSTPLQAARYFAAPSAIEWSSLDASPVYFPFYVAKYRMRSKVFLIYFEASQEKVGSGRPILPSPLRALTDLRFA
jgi:hypothetical protein